MMRRLSVYFLSGCLLPLCAFAGYRDKVSGDEAADGGDYPAAASFYERYRSEAVKAGDREAERDAYERRINALIHGRMPEVARQLLSEYTLRFPGVNPLSSGMWEADILLLQNKASEAVSKLERILPAITLEDPRRARAILSLAQAYEARGDCETAAKTYFSLRELPSASKDMVRRAWERGVFCQAFSEHPETALDSLLSAPGPETAADRRALRLLTVFTMIRNNAFPHTNAAWGDVLEDVPESADPLLYSLFSASGDAAAAQGRLETAAGAYRAAYRTASGKRESFETLQRLMDVLDSAGDSERAAELALASLRLFSGPYATPPVKLKAAGILRSAGKFTEAAELYRSMETDPLSSPGDIHTAMRECVYLYEEMKSPAQTDALIDTFFRTHYPGEAEFLKADILLRRGKFDDAMRGFLAAADAFPEWRTRALYQAAVAMLEAKQPERALGVIDRLSGGGGDSSAHADAVYLKAMALEATGRSADALAAYESYSSNPDAKSEFASKALFRAGRLAFLSGDAERAETLFDRLIRTFPDSPDAPPAACWRIYSFRSQGHELMAERETWRLVDSWPDSRYALDALFNLSGHYIDSGANDRANAVLDDLFKRVRTDDLKARVLLEKAAVAQRAGEFSAAKTLLARIDDEYPDSKVLAGVSYLRGDLYREAGDYGKALESYRRARTLNPEPMIDYAAAGSIGDCLFILAEKNQSKEMLSGASGEFRSLLAEPDLPEGVRVMTLFKAGRAEELLGNDDKALDLYKEALHMPAGTDTPEIRLWAAKAAEAVCSIAERKPLRSHIDAAGAALKLLEKRGILPAGTADDRIAKLRKNRRFNP